jgi:hypothetical protein
MGRTENNNGPVTRLYGLPQVAAPAAHRWLPNAVLPPVGVRRSDEARRRQKRSRGLRGGQRSTCGAAIAVAKWPPVGTVSAIMLATKSAGTKLLAPLAGSIEEGPGEPGDFFGQHMEPDRAGAVPERAAQPLRVSHAGVNSFWSRKSLRS